MIKTIETILIIVFVVIIVIGMGLLLGYLETHVVHPSSYTAAQRKRWKSKWWLKWLP